MNDKFQHILSKHGILISFNLAKKVKQSDVKRIRSELKKTCKNKEEINEKLQQMIILQIKNTLNSSEIPGLIQNKNQTKTSQKDPYHNIPYEQKQKIVNVATIANDLIKKGNLNLDCILIIIQILLMENKIGQKDIKDFNEKYNLKNLSDKNYIDNEDKDDGYIDDEDDDWPPDDLED